MRPPRTLLSVSHPIQGRRILVTGATAGIGAATAKAFCGAGAGHVFVVGRREDRLQSLAAAWAKEFAAHVTPVVLDVSDKDAVNRIAAKHPEVFDVDILVNNAGLARGTDAVQDADTDDWDQMVDVNVKGLLYVTREALPSLIKRKGHIVNLGSVAGRWTYPGGAVYCATKHAVRALSEGIRLDAQGTGLRVTNIEPGLVETEFSEVRFHGDKQRAAAVYSDTRALKAEDVADTILWCVGRPSHVNVQELVLYPTDQASVRDVVRG